MNKYLSQYADFRYKLIHMEDYSIFILMNNMPDIILEDIENFIGIVDNNYSNNETIEKMLKVQNLVKIYEEDIVGNKYKPPTYYF